MTPRLKIARQRDSFKVNTKLSLKNKHESKIEKVVINMGLGEDASDGKNLRHVLMTWH